VKQFDIVENPNKSTRTQYPFIVILQHDRLADYSGVIVAPLHPASLAFEKTRLHPIIRLQNRSFVLITEQMAAIPRILLRHAVGSAADQRYEIIAALDLLFTGI
jgi:toxin CcdB